MTPKLKIVFGISIALNLIAIGALLAVIGLQYWHKTHRIKLPPHHAQLAQHLPKPVHEQLKKFYIHKKKNKEKILKHRQKFLIQTQLIEDAKTMQDEIEKIVSHTATMARNEYQSMLHIIRNPHLDEAEKQMLLALLMHPRKNDMSDFFTAQTFFSLDY